MHQEDEEPLEERRNAEFADFFSQMQCEDNDVDTNSESIYMPENQAHPQPHDAGSSGAAQAIIAPGQVNAAAPITIPSDTAVDRQAVAAPSKSKACPKPKPKNAPASKKAPNTLETPEVGVDGRGVVDSDDVVNEVATVNGVQPAIRKGTRSRKGKGRAE